MKGLQKRYFHTIILAILLVRHVRLVRHVGLLFNVWQIVVSIIIQTQDRVDFKKDLNNV